MQAEQHMVRACALGPDDLICTPDQALSIDLILKSQWPHLYNGSKQEGVKRKNFGLGVLGFWMTVLALLSWLCVPDTSYHLVRVLVSNVSTIILPPLERAGVVVPAGTHVGGEHSHNLFGQHHSL